MADTYMTFAEMSDAIVAETQENDEDENLLFFLNSAVSEINIRLGTIFPLVAPNERGIEYTPIPNPWTKLLITWGNYRIKLANELRDIAEVFLDEFLRILTEFVDKFDIPDEYKGANFNKSKLAKIDWNQAFFNKKKDSVAQFSITHKQYWGPDEWLEDDNYGW